MSVVRIINYISAMEIPRSITKDLIEGSGFSNGHAQWWRVGDPEDEQESYPELNQYLINRGLSIGESVLLHFDW